jgi:hypothetical protein
LTRLRLEEAEEAQQKAEEARLESGYGLKIIGEIW